MGFHRGRYGIAGAACLAFALAALPATAQQATGTAVEGSPTVIINEAPAVRAGDATTQTCADCPAAPTTGTVTTGSSNVFINGQPAARVGDATDCGGTVVTGSSNVFINGQPAARVGDMTACDGQD